jgi:hypothetical protein
MNYAIVLAMPVIIFICVLNQIKMKKIFFKHSSINTLLSRPSNSSNNKPDVNPNNTPGNTSVVNQQTNDTAAPNKT